MEGRITRKSIRKYKSYIVDVDGTLYFQFGVRWKMIWSIICYIIKQPWKLQDIRIIYLYRLLRKNGELVHTCNFTDMEFAYVASKVNTTSEYVRDVVYHWMIEIPLKYIVQEKDKKLLDFLAERKKKGADIIVYSDYPIKEKLICLKFSYSKGYYSGDERIKCMKPDPKGLMNIIRENNLKVNNCLFIGDRLEKDGCCAEKCSMDYLILPKNKNKRKKVWKTLNIDEGEAY